MQIQYKKKKIHLPLLVQVVGLVSESAYFQMPLASRCLYYNSSQFRQRLWGFLLPHLGCIDLRYLSQSHRHGGDYLLTVVNDGPHCRRICRDLRLRVVKLYFLQVVVVTNYRISVVFIFYQIAYLHLSFTITCLLTKYYYSLSWLGPSTPFSQSPSFRLVPVTTGTARIIQVITIQVIAIAYHSLACKFVSLVLMKWWYTVTNYINKNNDYK